MHQNIILISNVNLRSLQNVLGMHPDHFWDILKFFEKVSFWPAILQNRMAGTRSKVHAGEPDLRHSIATTCVYMAHRRTS